MSQTTTKPRVGVIMGSDSDLPVMQAAADVLEELGVAYEMTIVSAHRTPKRLYDYSESAQERGLKVIIAGAGGAAHLPGMAAAITPLPVVGVPVKSSAMSGQDSLLSIVQMPPGVPVATVAINGARNAGILAAQIIGTGDAELLGRVAQFKRDLEAMVLGKVERMAGGAAASPVELSASYGPGPALGVQAFKPAGALQQGDAEGDSGVVDYDLTGDAVAGIEVARG